MVPPESRTIVDARRQLHGIAESFIAGPQYRAAGTIRLAVLPGGFTGMAVAITVHGTRLEWPEGTAELAGPVSEVVRAAGIDFGPPPDDVYNPVAPLALDAVLDVDPVAAQAVCKCLYAGGVALKSVLADGNPVLWPEHFDVAVTEDEVNYGVSGGDDGHPLPYAYVGPWNFDPSAHTAGLWNAPFGALHPLDFSADAHALADDIAAFFHRAQAHL